MLRLQSVDSMDSHGVVSFYFCVGRHSLGFGLYLFNYKAEFRNAYGHGRQFGVMASEVEAIVPAAVSEGPLGHKTVDYAMLGISRVVS